MERSNLKNLYILKGHNKVLKNYMELEFIELEFQ